MAEKKQDTVQSVAKAAHDEGKAYAKKNGVQNGAARQDCPYKAAEPKTLTALKEWLWMKGAYGEELPPLPAWAEKLELQ